ncbi:hypothetical protein [Brachyspira hyodysenteriae]|uniref:hypothetical protein n=1 Tax=Brachyspira hyodysenteriae TaxID=159 RepID=UPI0022CD79D7|nr:hypothetical protein [Brachyspira hyodysenteriae]MCZ9966188.1 hypothetical protein [Brachyspira hyodysenteriae]
MPSGGNECTVQIRPRDRVIETSTNTIIVKKDAAPPVKESNEIKILSSDNFVENPVVKNPMIEKPLVENNIAENNFNYNLEAMNNLNNASKSFNTPNNYVNNTDELSDKFRSIIERYKNEGAIDLVIVLDTTESMHLLFENHKKRYKRYDYRII